MSGADGVHEFVLPDLGEGLTSAEIVRWLVEVGEVVAVDQPVVEVETAKALVEVPCPYGGVVTARFGEPGEERPVGAPLVTVATSADGSGAEHEGSGSVLVGYGTTAGPRTRRRRVAPAPADARRKADDAGSAPVGGVPIAVISPLVRRLARTHDLDLRRVPGSGPDGLITRSDVQRALDDRAAAPSAPSGEPAAGTVPLRGLARAAAETFVRSHREIPDATCWVDADATGLLAAREALNASARAPRIGLLALLARICVLALVRHPELNSTVVDGPSGPGVRRNPRVQLGIAAQTDRGLLVPVLRDADLLSTERLAAAVAATAEAARAGRLGPAELTGGTFTLNDYGVYGVDGSTPIINHPEAAMLGVGRIAAKPWVHEGELAVRQVVQLSLTFDHRVCDGATAGHFLREIADAVESPITLLREL
jgi:pyruvate dehydrogenase E2 component (dihydrolipoamide acetyltransferase)